MTERSSRPVWLGEDRRGWDHARLHLQLLHDDRLDAYALAVYFGLAAHAETRTGEARPSIETLARYGQMSARTAAARVRLLRELGYIGVESGKTAGVASIYTLLPPPQLSPGMHQVPTYLGTTRRPPRHQVPTRYAPGADELEPLDQNQERARAVVVSGSGAIPAIGRPPVPVPEPERVAGLAVARAALRGGGR